jgi:hypothetical protein
MVVGPSILTRLLCVAGKTLELYIPTFSAAESIRDDTGNRNEQKQIRLEFSLIRTSLSTRTYLSNMSNTIY